MKKFEKILFPPDQDWLSSCYQNMDEVFNSFEFLVNYIKKRFPHVSDAEIESYRNSFLIEQVSVRFCDEKECPELMLHIGFGENRMVVFIPDDHNLSDEDKMELRKEYTFYYGRMIKESNVRVMTLLWSLIPEKMRVKIQEDIKKNK